MITFHIIGFTARAGQTPAVFGQQKSASRPPSLSTEEDTASPSIPTEAHARISKAERGTNNGEKIS